MTSDAIDSFHGVYAATVCPLDPTGRHLDEAALAQHLEEVAAVDGITGLLLNGHAGENFLLSRDEKRRVLQIARSHCAHTVLVAGVNAESSYEAQAHAEDARQAGADALLLFPPFSWTASIDLESVVAHHRIVNETARLPMMLYQATVDSGSMAYTRDMLAALIRLPQVVAIKEGSWETSTYDANRRLVKALAPQVAVMASGDEHLFPCFAIGTDGCLVSLAAVVPSLIVALYRAVQAQDLAEARRLHSHVYPLAKAIYGTSPAAHANARLKACLHLLGKLPHAAMRPPIAGVAPIELAPLERALAIAVQHDRRVP